MGRGGDATAGGPAASGLRRRGGPAGGEGEGSLEARGEGALGRVIKLEEIRRHKTKDDLWVSVHGKVYDVTRFVPKHPGGSMIYVKGGRDISQLFDAYHPLRAQKVLQQFYIGELEGVREGRAFEQVQYEADMGEGEFYRVVKERVERYFKDHRLDPRFSVAMYVKTACILGGLFLAYAGTFYAAATYAGAFLCAVLFGVCKAEIGVSIQHDANHGAYCKSKWLGDAIGCTLDMVGASSFMWKQQHVVGHHAFTNTQIDPDIRVGDDDIRRVTPEQPWSPKHRFQHLYLGLLYGLLSLKSVTVDDFKSLADGHIGPTQLTAMEAWERAVFWGGKAFFYGAWYAAPAFLSPWSLGQLAGLWLVAEAVTGWLLAFMFQVAHVVEGVDWLRVDDRTGKVPTGWAAGQVATSADFCHGSWFWTHFSGGLNYQTAHHLFPGVCHCHYPAITPIIMETCAEFGLKYNVYATFPDAVRGHFKYLEKVGLEGVLDGAKIPSLHNVG